MEEISSAINQKWQDLLIETIHDSETHIGMSRPFIAPSVNPTNDFVFKEQFYWDTYFTILPFIGSEKHEVAKGMVDNLLELLSQLGYVPNSNNRHHLGRSQPPFLSSMVRLIYENEHDKTWLTKAYGLLVEEYYTVWLSDKHPHNRKVDQLLSRYYHENQEHSGAEDESGWDKNTRFEDRALDFLPVDLNSLLYKYEIDFAYFSKELNNGEETTWFDKAAQRKQRINELMWSEQNGFFYDYDFVNNKQSRVKSLASYVPLFVGLTDENQASKLQNNMELFETEFGLTTTAKTDALAPYKQWSSPNGWAPLHYMVVTGLEFYKYHEDAARIAKKWVTSVNIVYQKTGEFFEKYNMNNPSLPPTSGIYPDQKGFAWTNAVTEMFIRMYY